MTHGLLPALVVGLAGVVLLPGCATLPSEFLGASLSGPLQPLKRRRNDKEAALPPKEAAVVCLTTANLLERNGHDLQAIHQYELARHYDPGVKGVSHRLAVLYQRQGQFSRAKAEYESALRESPKDPDLLNDFGYFHYERGDWQEAENWLRLAVEQKPDHRRALVNLGMALGMQGRYAESLETFERALSPAEAQVNLAFILTTHGKREEAKQAYRAAIALQPDLQIARAALAKLEGVSLSNEQPTRPEMPVPANSEAADPGTATEPVHRSVSPEDKAAAITRLERFVKEFQANSSKPVSTGFSQTPTPFTGENVAPGPVSHRRTSTPPIRIARPTR